MSTRYFRAGVGTVIYNDVGDVALFERAQEPIGIWQFQQGGIDHGEDPMETLWRELMEEVGLSQNEIEVATELPGWHPYQDLNSLTDNAVHRIGQIHRWFFLKLKPEVTIDLAKATDKEFQNWRWTSFEEAIALTGEHKQPVYKMLHTHFTSHIFPKHS